MSPDDIAAAMEKGEAASSTPATSSAPADLEKAQKRCSVAFFAAKRGE